jgi:Flp pilus assembly protein TadG
MTKRNSVSAGGRRSQRGQAVVEAAFLAPLFIFLFVGVFDLGFYAYALTATENAVRVAATYTSTSSSTAADSTTACTLALGELNDMPNMQGVTTCTALPLIVTATAVSGPDGANASQVVVQYQTVQLVPIPGLLPGRLTFNRTSQMRLKS